jgi:indolepyruvate ferredoxin oxidoreductase
MVAKLLGDTMSTNIFLLGFAYQKGYLPLKASSLEEAISLNNVAVDMNLRAFAWGRVAAAEPERLAEFVGPSTQNDDTEFDLDQFIEDRKADLTSYQNAAYAERYQTTVTAIRDAEQKSTPGYISFRTAIICVQRSGVRSAAQEGIRLFDAERLKNISAT